MKPPEALTRSIGGAIVLRAAGLVGRLVVALALASMLGASQVGEYFLAVGSVGLGALAARGGYDEWALGDTGQNPDHAGDIWFILGRRVAFRSLIMSIPLFVFITVVFRDLPMLTIAWSVAAMTLINLNALSAAVLRGKSSLNAALLVSEVGPPVAQLLVFLVLPMEFTSGRAAASQFAGFLIGTTLGCYLLVGIWRESRGSSTWAPPSWKQTLPMLIVGANGQFRRSFVAIAAWVLGSPVAAGAMGAAFRLEQALLLPVTATRFATAPRLASRGSHLSEAVIALAVRSARLAVFVQIPVIVAALLFAPDLLGLLGDDFRQGDNWLRVLLLGSLVNSLTGSTRQVLLMSDSREVLGRTSTIASIVLAVVGIGAGLAFGMVGVAVGLAASFVATAFTEWKQIVSRLHARVDPFVTTQSPDGTTG